MLAKSKIVAMAVMIASFLVLGSVMLSGKMLGRDMAQQQLEIVAEFSQDRQAEQDTGLQPDTITFDSSAGTALLAFVALAAVLALTIVIHYRTVLFNM